MRRPTAILTLTLVTALCGLSGCGAASGTFRNASGQVAYRQANYTMAAADFAKASMDNPVNATYAYNLGRSLAKLGRTAEAEHHFRRALAIDPRHQPAYHGLATLLDESGRPQEAESLLSAWAATQPHLPGAHVELAALKRRQGDFASAEKSLRHALTVDPSDPTTLAQLGDLYQVSGRPQEAVAMFRQSLAKDPFQSEVKGRLAAIQTPPREIQQAAHVAAPQMIAGQPNPTGFPQAATYQPAVPFGVPPFTTAATAFSPVRPTYPPSPYAVPTVNPPMPATHPAAMQSPVVAGAYHAPPMNAAPSMTQQVSGTVTPAAYEEPAPLMAPTQPPVVPAF